MTQREQDIALLQHELESQICALYAMRRSIVTEDIDQLYSIAETMRLASNATILLLKLQTQSQEQLQ